MTRVRDRGKSASSRDTCPDAKQQRFCSIQRSRLYGHEYTPHPLPIQARYTLRYTQEGGFPWAGSCSSSYSA